MNLHIRLLKMMSHNQSLRIDEMTRILVELFHANDTTEPDVLAIADTVCCRRSGVDSHTTDRIDRVRDHRVERIRHLIHVSFLR